MSYFCFLSVQTVSFCGHIARYAPLSADILPSKQIQKSDSGNFQNPPIMNGKIKAMLSGCESIAFTL